MYWPCTWRSDAVCLPQDELSPEEQLARRTLAEESILAQQEQVCLASNSSSPSQCSIFGGGGGCEYFLFLFLKIMQPQSLHSASCLEVEGEVSPFCFVFENHATTKCKTPFTVGGYIQWQCAERFALVRITLVAFSCTTEREADLWIGGFQTT